LFGRGERLERRADDLHSEPVLINWTPRGYEAGIALKAETASALIVPIVNLNRWQLIENRAMLLLDV